MNNLECEKKIYHEVEWCTAVFIANAIPIDWKLKVLCDDVDGSPSNDLEGFYVLSRMLAHDIDMPHRMERSEICTKMLPNVLKELISFHSCFDS